MTVNKLTVFHFSSKNRARTKISVFVNKANHEVGFIVSGDVMDNIVHIDSIAYVCGFQVSHHQPVIGEEYNGVTLTHTDVFDDEDCFRLFHGNESDDNYTNLCNKILLLADACESVPTC